MNTFMASPSTIERKWYVVDATGYTLGRLAANVAAVLRGKNKPTFTPSLDTGDYVIIVNADKVKVTGKKLDQKIYFNHSDSVSYTHLRAHETKANLKVTGKKLDQKIYFNHSDYVGGMKETTLRELMAKKPERAVELAVKGMLPKGPLGRTMYTKLHVYAGPEHDHAAQKPETLTF